MFEPKSNLKLMKLVFFVHFDFLFKKKKKIDGKKLFWTNTVEDILLHWISEISRVTK